MRFSQLLSHLSEVQAAGGPQGLSHSLAEDPALQGAAALDQSGPAELSFLEPGNALAAALAWILQLLGFDARGGIMDTYEQRNALVVGIAVGLILEWRRSS